MAYLVVPPINIIVTLLYRTARVDRFERIVVANIVANAVVWLGMVSLIVVTGGEPAGSARYDDDRRRAPS